MKLTSVLALVLLLLAQIVQRTSATDGDTNDGTPDINAPHPPNNNPSDPQARSKVVLDFTGPGALLGKIDLICAIGGEATCMAVCVNQGGSKGICDFTEGCQCYV